MKLRSVTLATAALVMIWTVYSLYSYEPLFAAPVPTPIQTLEKPESAADPAPPSIHLVISTDCSYFQDWQSLGVAYSNWIHGIQHYGRITRLAACSNPHWIPPRVPTVLSSIYQVVVAPSFDPHPLTGDAYSPRNRPQSLAWLLQNQSNYIRDNEIVVLVDPDEFMVQDWKDLYPFLLDSVRPGVALAAEFLQGSAYLSWASKFCKECSDRIDSMTYKEKDELQIGAPYVLLGKDLKNLAPRYARILEEMRLDAHAVQEGGWIIEMHAYTISTIEANVHHKRLPMMVSAPAVDPEPWDRISSKSSTSLPLFIAHFCQRLNFKGYSWSKHDFKGTDYSDCKKPFRFPVPSEEVLNWVHGLSFEQPISQEERAAWMYSHVVELMHEALKLYSVEYCWNSN